MADDSALRAELQAAIDAIDPQVRGLKVLAKVLVSPSGNVAISTQIEIRMRRRDSIGAVLAALDSVVTAQNALVADGYPDLPQVQLNAGVLEEVQETENDLVIATGIFGATAATPQDRATISRIDAGMKANQAAISEAMQS